MPWGRTRDIVRGNKKWHVSAKSFGPGGEVTTVTLHWWRRDRSNIGQEHSEITIPADVFEEIVAFVHGEAEEAPSLVQQVDELMWRHRNGFLDEDGLRREMAALSETTQGEER